MATLAMLTLAGCASTASVRIEQRFPSVVSTPRDIHAALILDDAFRVYTAKPNENTTIDIGTAQVDVLSKAFQGLFREVDVLASRTEMSPGTKLVIVPSVMEVQVSSPNESYLNVYEVWIKYNLSIESADGVPIDNWFLPAYGKTPDSMMLSRSKGLEEATIVALRDAGAKLILDFYRIPAVNGWIREQQSP